MTAGKNRQITLASRPTGEPKDENFTLIETPVPEPGAGQMLCRTIYLSLDPYMRGRMSAAKSYAKPVEPGQVMVGGTVSEVVESNLPGFAAGDFVLGANGWQEYALSDGSGVRKLDPAQAPLSYALGVLGMPGFTAYVGLLDIGRPQAGETVVVSAASGAVGSVVGQIAKVKGARVVGIAGSSAKCDYVIQELEFDTAVNYKDADFAARLGAATPDGIDVYYENVGGKVFEAVLDLLNVGARIPVCGQIAHYNATEPPPGPNLVPKLMGIVLRWRVTIRGFIIFDHDARQPDFLKDMSQWVRSGAIKVREDIVDGLENAPRAFQGLLRGENFGKLVVRVSDDPTR